MKKAKAVNFARNGNIEHRTTPIFICFLELPENYRPAEIAEPSPDSMRQSKGFEIKAVSTEPHEIRSWLESDPNETLNQHKHLQILTILRPVLASNFCSVSPPCLVENDKDIYVLAICFASHAGPIDFTVFGLFPFHLSSSR